MTRRLLWSFLLTAYRRRSPFFAILGRRARNICAKWGGIIMVASIVIWALGYYPDHDAYQDVAEQQENSYIGRIGKAVNR